MSLYFQTPSCHPFADISQMFLSLPSALTSQHLYVSGDMATLLGRLVGVANSPICIGSLCYGPPVLVVVSPSFHLPRHIPATILMLLFLLHPAPKQSENPVGFTFNEHPELGHSLPLCSCRCGVNHHRFFLGLWWAPPPWSLASALAPDRWVYTHTL